MVKNLNPKSFVLYMKFVLSLRYSKRIKHFKIRNKKWINHAETRKKHCNIENGSLASGVKATFPVLPLAVSTSTVIGWYVKC